MSTSGTQAETTLRATMRGTGTGNVSGSAESGAASGTRRGTGGVPGPGTAGGAPEAGRRRSGDAPGREVRTKSVSGSGGAAGAERGPGESASARRSLGVGRALSPQRQVTLLLMMGPWGSPALMDQTSPKRRAGTGTGTDAAATVVRGRGGGTGIEIASTKEATGVKGGMKPPVVGVAAAAAAAVARTTGLKGLGLMGGTSIWRPMLAMAIWLLRMAT
uniref:Uncharacterized protein n=1 Tax=Monodelphis domestica TaxID=13616 RepID=F6U6Z5_MONDO